VARCFVVTPRCRLPERASRRSALSCASRSLIARSASANTSSGFSSAHSRNCSVRLRRGEPLNDRRSLSNTGMISAGRLLRTALSSSWERSRAVERSGGFLTASWIWRWKTRSSRRVRLAPTLELKALLLGLGFAGHASDAAAFALGLVLEREAATLCGLPLSDSQRAVRHASGAARTIRRRLAFAASILARSAAKASRSFWRSCAASSRWVFAAVGAQSWHGGYLRQHMELVGAWSRGDERAMNIAQLLEALIISSPAHDRRGRLRRLYGHRKQSESARTLTVSSAVARRLQ
jgi:hypothetical protein